MNTAARFLDEMVDRSAGPEGCWRFLGTITSNGYGHFKLDGRMWMAHRLALSLAGRHLPDDQVVDHLCRNRACVNPAHLDVVDNWENVRRGISFSAINAAKAQCDRGHEFSTENTYVTPKGWRQCRTCQRSSRAAYRARRRVA